MAPGMNALFGVIIVIIIVVVACIFCDLCLKHFLEGPDPNIQSASVAPLGQAHGGGEGQGRVGWVIGADGKPHKLGADADSGSRPRTADSGSRPRTANSGSRPMTVAPGSRPRTAPSVSV